MNEQVVKPRGMLSGFHNYLNAWMGGIFVNLPLLFVWWRMAANGLGGQETTFAFSRDPSGKWMAASELIFSLLRTSWFSRWPLGIPLNGN